MPEHTLLALVTSVAVQPGETSSVGLASGLQLNLARKQPESIVEKVVQRALTEKRKIAIKIDADGKTIKAAYWPAVDTVFTVGKLDRETKKLALMLKLRPAPVFLAPSHPKFGDLETLLRSLEGKGARIAVDPATSAIEAAEPE